MIELRTEKVVLQAEQWEEGVSIEGVVTPSKNSFDDGNGCTNFQPYLHTPDIDYPIESGDWIITEDNGDKFVCKNSIFQAVLKIAKREKHV